MKVLERDGWSWEKLPPKSKRAGLSIMSVEGPKVWYCATKTSAFKHYILPLLHIGKLATAELLPLDHGQKDAERLKHTA